MHLSKEYEADARAPNAAMAASHFHSWFRAVLAIPPDAGTGQYVNVCPSPE